MPKRKTPDNVSAFVDRHGKERWRYRKTGEPTHYFKSMFGTPEFEAELQQTIARAPKPIGAARIVPGTIADLITRWYRSGDFAGGNDRTRHKMRGIVERFRAEFGDDRVADFTFEHVEAILVRTSRKRLVAGKTLGGPEAAARLRKMLGRLFTHAVKLKLIVTDPVALASSPTKPKPEGFHTWTEEEIRQFEVRHALGTKARLALEIMVWTAQRGGDARQFGPAHMRGGRVNFTAAKNRRELWLPAAPQLLAAIRAMPAIGVTTYLVTEYGKPFSEKGFGNWFRGRCDEADLPHCTAHGLRKAAARRAAELGGTNQQLKAIGGWAGDQEVSIYTAGAEQAKLASDALGRVIEWDLANRNSGLANASRENG